MMHDDDDDDDEGMAWPPVELYKFVLLAKKSQLDMSSLVVHGPLEEIRTRHLKGFSSKSFHFLR